MRVALKLHPDSVCDAVTSIEVEAARNPLSRGLSLQYWPMGNLEGLRISPPFKVERRDELWRHTCFEAFVRSSHHAEYYEFNFSPSGGWAAYRFDRYRSGMADLSIDDPIKMTRSEGSPITLDLASLSELPNEESWRIGLSAVIEETNGRLSYWALRHPPGKPDFHHPDCFALELPPPSTA